MPAIMVQQSDRRIPVMKLSGLNRQAEKLPQASPCDVLYAQPEPATHRFCLVPPLGLRLRDLRFNRDSNVARLSGGAKEMDREALADAAACNARSGPQLQPPRMSIQPYVWR